ncbi:hypothetical protein [Spirosoma sp.]|uniref:hypothetical protein n=1 Tax=Spirosoma sp. TaxID=1899569 RepID=UPI00260FF5B4|nr:hypothetical protein [Spirosoma sp.]MCX6213236.1 hypothetical protein [Spirosoma sp.]
MAVRKEQVTLTVWTGLAYGAVKRIVVPYEYGLIMSEMMSQYAEENGFVLALRGENNTAGLFWNREGQIVRLAIEEAI